LWSINERLGGLLPKDSNLGIDLDQPNKDWMIDLFEIAQQEAKDNEPPEKTQGTSKNIIDKYTSEVSYPPLPSNKVPTITNKEQPKVILR
jgi:hypothetical protein